MLKGVSAAGHLATGVPDRQRPTSRAASHSTVASSSTALLFFSTSSWRATCAQKPDTSWASRRTTWKDPLNAQVGSFVGPPMSERSTCGCPQTNSPAGISRVPGCPLTHSGRSGSGSSKPRTPGSLTPSLKPKCSLPRRVPGSVEPFCWKTTETLNCAADSRCSITAACRSSAVSAATVSTAWMNSSDLLLPKIHFDGELGVPSLSPRIAARATGPCWKAPIAVFAAAGGYGALPVSFSRPWYVKLMPSQVAFSPVGSPPDRWRASLKALLKVATCRVVAILGVSRCSQPRALTPSSNLRNSRTIWSFLKPARMSPWISALSRSGRSVAGGVVSGRGFGGGSATGRSVVMKAPVVSPGRVPGAALLRDCGA